MKHHPVCMQNSMQSAGVVKLAFVEIEVSKIEVIYFVG